MVAMRANSTVTCHRLRSAAWYRIEHFSLNLGYFGATNVLCELKFLIFASRAMLDYRIIAEVTVDDYRKRILTGYTFAGLAVGFFGMACTGEFSIASAAIFTASIVVFAWVGGAVANGVWSLDDSWKPWVQRKAIVRSLPLGLSSMAMLAIGMGLLALIAPGLMYVAGIAYGAWVRKLVVTRDATDS
jgi:hypothetical protein